MRRSTVPVRTLEMLDRHTTTNVNTAYLLPFSSFVKLPRVAVVPVALTLVCWSGSAGDTSVAAALMSTASTPAASSQAVFRSGTTIVALQVTVLDEKRRHVRGLRAKDFAVYEEGKPQTVSVFARETTPLDVMLLLDTSDSMRAHLPAMRRAAINLVRTLVPGNRAGVLLFNQRVQFAQEMTGDAKQLEHAIERMSTGGGTLIYDALDAGLAELSDPRGDLEPRRRALVAITDGEDTGSQVGLDGVFERASRSPVTIYVIAPPEPAHASMFDAVPRATRLFNLRRLAGQSGGRMFVPERGEQLAAAGEEISTELRHQYWIGYVPTSFAEQFRRVSVHVVSNPSLRAHTRTGYAATDPRRSQLRIVHGLP